MIFFGEIHVFFSSKTSNLDKNRLDIFSFILIYQLIHRYNDTKLIFINLV